MSLSVWSFPTRIVFGNGAVKQTGAEAKRTGASRALIVTDKGVAKAGLLAPIEASLRAAGLTSAIFDDVLPNPIEKNVHDGVRAFREADADIVVAVGGGSPLDIGKLIRLRVHHHRPLVEYDDATGGDQHITSNVPPMIAIPTTAGTGSEVGRSGVVTLEANHRKTVIFSPHLMASAALLDPEITAGLPPFLTAATGFDALTHNLEAYVSKGNHPMADGIAIQGLRLTARYLERATKQGDDLEARGGMMQAAMMGAVAFQKGLGACHSLAHPLSTLTMGLRGATSAPSAPNPSEHGLHHGLANALCLPAVVEYNEPAAAERLAEVARIFGAEPSAKGCAAALRELRARLGLPSGLGAAGIPKESLPKLADLAFQDACHTLNPRPCSRDDLLSLYEASY